MAPQLFSFSHHKHCPEVHSRTSDIFRECKGSTVNHVDEHYWDAEISAFPEATFFHGSAWARVLHDTYGFEPVYFNQGRQGPFQSALPAMEAVSCLVGKRGISLPFTDECAPLCRDAVAFERLHSALTSSAVRRKWNHWEMRGGRLFLPAAPASLAFWGHKLALNLNRPDLFSRIDSSTRRAIRKAEQSDLQVEFSISPETVRIFYRLLGLTRRRHGLPPQPFGFFENIQRHILSKGQGTIALARLNEIPVAGLMFFQFGSTALYKFGVSDESFQHVRANNLLMWRSIEWYSERGCVYMDFGRTSLGNVGLRRFKRAWGATERLIEYFRYDRKEARFVASRDDSTGWHNRLFRLMPLSLSRLVGTAAYKHMA